MAHPILRTEFFWEQLWVQGKRNAHQAVKHAQKLLNEGKQWVVGLDLEKFFDRVNHDRLMWLLGRKASDKATLRLIRQYLKSGIMEGGVVSPPNANNVGKSA